ncbi:hypothetical protein NMY22_g19915 [Coprinellus aureogranulatus]|nr:hypothetical protein NMY22_g19915 [Coprinellus aureogranulatus]
MANGRENAADTGTPQQLNSPIVILPPGLDLTAIAAQGVRVTSNQSTYTGQASLNESNGEGSIIVQMAAGAPSKKCLLSLISKHLTVEYMHATLKRIARDFEKIREENGDLAAYYQESLKAVSFHTFVIAKEGGTKRLRKASQPAAAQRTPREEVRDHWERKPVTSKSNIHGMGDLKAKDETCTSQQEVVIACSRTTSVGSSTSGVHA